MKKYLLFILAFICLSFSAQAAEAIDVNIRGNGTEITEAVQLHLTAKFLCLYQKQLKLRNIGM